MNGQRLVEGTNSSRRNEKKKENCKRAATLTGRCTRPRHKSYWSEEVGIHFSSVQTKMAMSLLARAFSVKHRRWMMASEVFEQLAIRHPPVPHIK